VKEKSLEKNQIFINSGFDNFCVSCKIRGNDLSDGPGTLVKIFVVSSES